MEKLGPILGLCDVGMYCCIPRIPHSTVRPSHLKIEINVGRISRHCSEFFFPSKIAKLDIQ